MTTNRSSGYGWVVGFTAFAAMLMILVGFFQFFIGLVAILNQDFYVTTPDYVFAFDIGTWGWIHLIWGIVVLAGGVSLLTGAIWARALGAVLAVFSAIEAFLFLPYQPFWSVIVVALSILVIWALTTRATVDEAVVVDDTAV